MEKRNIVEAGRTPRETEKTAEAVDAGVSMFKSAGLTKDALKADKPKEEKTHVAK